MQPCTTPYTAITKVRSAGSPLAQLATMLAAARRHRARGDARSLAVSAAAPEAIVRVLRTPERQYVGLVRLRYDQAWAVPYALERGCAVLPVEGADALPDGWEEFE